jgi:hypothetical protein
MFEFNSQIKEVGTIDVSNVQESDIKNAVMLFSSNIDYAYNTSDVLTRKFIDALPEEWKNDPSVIIDSRVHMLMKGWFSCIPGFHHDDVPRSREDGQPNYITPEYNSEHILCLVNGEICPTEFAIGEAEFEDVPIGGKYYKTWHGVVEKYLKEGKLDRYSAPSNTLVYFDWQTWHQGVRAIKDGWRWFIRATRNTNRTHKNEIRRQVQVYLDAPLEGW